MTVERIGRYRIDGDIGEGAMAHVYLAHDPSIDRQLAIKVLKGEFRSEPEIVRRFLGESHAAGMLSHAHIVTIFDVGEVDGMPYIAMERLEGKPLDERLESEGKLSVANALTLAAQIASALAYAHRSGVVHRDIKPSNILICDGGRTAKLVDFGIARTDSRDEIHAEREVQRTQAGQVMGTPRYMSPEQAMGLPVDARSDLFSLGAVLYEMLAGKPAFPGKGLATLAIQIAQMEPEAIDRHVRDCPSGLKFILKKLLAKKPGERFADADALHQALQRELEAIHQEQDASRRGLALRIGLPLRLAAAAALALALSVSFVLDRQHDTLEQMALTSGRSMTDFVASNAGMRIAENAGLPSENQDWMPLQAFVESAARDGKIRHLVIADDQNIVRAADNKALIGTAYRGNPGEPSVGPAWATQSADGIRFIRAVHYAGAEFGSVDLVFDPSELDAAMRDAHLLLGALSIFVIGVVAAIGYWSARSLLQPMRRLRQAMEDAAGGNLSFRLSHKRKDEIGSLFDAFNRLASEMDGRPGDKTTEQAILMTRIESPPASRQAREAA